jgi:hypothetical protein
MRNYLRIIRAGCSAAVAFLAFLLLFVCLETFWPGFEHSRRSGWLVGPAYVALIVAELYYYYHLRIAIARVRFFRRHAGATFVIGTTRKGWYPLFNTMVGSSAPRTISFVWWREISFSELGIFALHRPPVDLPFAILVRPHTLDYIALGDSLRPFSRGQMRVQAGAVLDALKSLLRGAA